MIFGGFLFGFCSPVTVFANATLEAHGELYSEQTYLSQQETLTSHLRLRAESSVTEVLTPYLQLGNELSSKVTDPFNFDSASYVHVGPGLHVKLGKFSLYGEARVRKFYQDSSRPNLDIRSLIVFGDFIEWVDSKDWSRFVELYSETVYTSADSHNVIHSSFARTGLRRRLSLNTSLDFFFEPFVTLDRVKHYYNNRADLKVSARVNHRISAINVSLVGSYLQNFYFSRGDQSNNPYGATASGARVLLVVGGSL